MQFCLGSLNHKTLAVVGKELSASKAKTESLPNGQKRDLDT